MALKGDLPEIIRQFIQGELRGLYTVLPCIVDRVRTDERRVDVRLKDQRRNVLDNNDKGIPVASPYAGDGFGELYPIKPEDEGFLLFTKDPIQEALASRGEVDVERHRQHSLNDCFFLPRVFFDDDEIPAVDGDVNDLEYLMWHESDTWFRIGEEGAYEIQHRDGHNVTIAGSSDTLSETGGSETGGGPNFIKIEHTDGHYIEIDEQGVWFVSSAGHFGHISDDLIAFELASGLRWVMDNTTTPSEVRVEGRERVQERFLAGTEGSPPDDGILVDLEGAKGDNPPANADNPIAKLYSTELQKLRVENRDTDYAQSDTDVETGTVWYNATDSQLRIMTDSGVQDIQHS